MNIRITRTFSLGQRIKVDYRLLLAIPIVMLVIASRWNVDPYHEGAIFPTAVGIAQGNHVFLK